MTQRSYAKLFVTFVQTITSCSIQLSRPCFAAPTGYTLVEAEADPHGTVTLDPSTSGGEYVEQTGGYQPMIFATLPTAGDSWVIWARIKDVNLQLKAVAADGTQTPLNWEWNRPDDWTWVSFGRHSRTELISKILLMRGPDAGAHPGLDAVVFADNDSFDPNVSINIPVAPLPTVEVSINWATTIAQATRASYGLNAFQAFDPAVTQNPTYETNMTLMHPGILRIHNWGMMGDSQSTSDGWIDNTHQCWDEAKIRTVCSMPTKFRLTPHFARNWLGL